MRINFGVFILLGLLCPILGHAKVKNLVRQVEGLVNPEAEEVVRVQTARVVLADYDLIRADFAETRALSTEQIHQWLLDHAAYISRAQASQTAVNSKIEIQKDSAGRDLVTTAYRPQLYGRALVYKAGDGLLDMKGAGTLQAPLLASHRTGLGSLGEMIREFIFQKKIQQVLNHSGSGLQTVESYAVIDWGFDAKELDGGMVRAGAVLRQAHARPRRSLGGNHFASTLESKIIEDLLRHYGITSTGDNATETLERVNIQVSKDGDLVDFGAYFVRGQFQKMTVHYLSSEALSDPKLEPSAQPDPRDQLPLPIWGSTETKFENPRYDNPWVWSHKLAQDLKSGAARPEHVQKHYENMMAAGNLSEQTAGTFKNIHAAEFIQATRLKILKLNLNLKGAVSTDLINDYLSNSLGVIDPQVLQLLVQNSFLEKYGENVWALLSLHKVLDSHPELLEKIIAGSRFRYPDILYSLLKQKKYALLSPLLSSGRIDGLARDEFLDSIEVKYNPDREQWLRPAESFRPPSCKSLFKG
jgi:hypothetical protein